MCDFADVMWDENDEEEVYEKILLSVTSLRKSSTNEVGSYI